ncbi:zonular occludens toxin domain-containing protein [Hydrogenophaga electricum]|uniref:Zona occludens toxin N-terminal domain-containing protein n=1 Tax=Hydrogenophaga electricum TaxID=1230953 RepID=A0ABQ6C083_9BURK|nr:zonular occludens toxin domain-containing protein [Hydrogenophaga electricum]GLS13651.1 hypothetical protein GCM10007935_10810 [Hydrogenophaga electricum]
MAITLITGAPGNGKTLLLLWEVERRRQAEKRPVYYSGVKDLLLPWELFGNDSADPSAPHMTDPANWNTLPVGSIIVIDEAQRLFRNRAVGSKVPDYVAALETHRHKGYDIYLVTQAPALVDSNVRNLVETHKHLMRKFGSRWATIHEWKGVKANCITTRKDSIESQFRYPKEVYTWYKSAEVHTVKVRIPAKVIVLMLLPLGLLAAGWIAWQKLTYLHTPASDRGKDPSAISPSQGTQQQQQARPMASAAPNWYEGWAPRVPGLPHTAPRYDEVTKPSTAPYPAACLTFGNDCRCYTQQATRMDVDDGLCRDIAANGYFVDWQQPQQQAQQQAQPAQQQPDKPSATLDQPRNVTGSLRPSDPRDADLIAWVHRKPAL